LRDTAIVEAPQAIVDLDLDELVAIEPPHGFGRDRTCVPALDLPAHRGSPPGAHRSLPRIATPDSQRSLRNARFPPWAPGRTRAAGTRPIAGFGQRGVNSSCRQGEVGATTRVRIQSRRPAKRVRIQPTLTMDYRSAGGVGGATPGLALGRKSWLFAGSDRLRFDELRAGHPMPARGPAATVPAAAQTAPYGDSRDSGHDHRTGGRRTDEPRDDEASETSESK
jgi:hypothetical protein